MCSINDTDKDSCSLFSKKKSNNYLISSEICALRELLAFRKQMFEMNKRNIACFQFFLFLS